MIPAAAVLPGAVPPGLPPEPRTSPGKSPKASQSKASKVSQGKPPKASQSTACATCYKAKAKCIMTAAGVCTRCERYQIQCVARIPKTRGRKPAAAKNKKRKAAAMSSGGPGGAIWELMSRVGLTSLPVHHFGLRATIRYMLSMATRQENPVAAVAKVFAIAAHLGLELQEVRKIAMVLSNKPVIRKVEWDGIGSAMVRDRHNHAVTNVLTRSSIPCGSISSRFIIAVHSNGSKDLKFYHSNGCNAFPPFMGMSDDAWKKMLCCGLLHDMPERRSMVPSSIDKVVTAIGHLIKAFSQPVTKSALSKSVLVNDVRFNTCPEIPIQCIMTFFCYSIDSGIYITEFIMGKPAKRKSKNSQEPERGEGSSSGVTIAEGARAPATRTGAAAKGGLQMLLEMLT